MAKLYNIPFNKIMFCHYYPHLNLTVPVKLTEVQISNLLNGRILKKIQVTRKKKKSELRPMINNYCGNCEMKGICPAFNTQEQIKETLNKNKDLIVEHQKKRDERMKNKKIIKV
jgi:hypothetical protein